MTIEVHCDHCGRLLRAPRESAGKRATCPACGQDVYVPTPHDELEELDLVPLDESDEQQREQFRKQEQELEEELRKETRSPEQPGRSPAQGGRNLDPLARTSPGQMERHVMAYLRAMVDQELSKAEQLAETLCAESSSALAAVDRLMADDAALARFRAAPRPVLEGFLRELRAQLEQAGGR